MHLCLAYGLGANNAHIGGPDAKTACNIALLKDIQSHTDVPFDRLALGFQSHINETNFVHKADLTNTFAALADLGVEAMVTEIDITLNSTSDEDLRFQAAIWGDYIDVRSLLFPTEPSCSLKSRSIGLSIREQLPRVYQLGHA